MKIVRARQNPIGVGSHDALRVLLHQGSVEVPAAIANNARWLAFHVICLACVVFQPTIDPRAGPRPGFGTFTVRKKGQRIGRNPKTGVEVIIKPRRVLAFRASPPHEDPDECKATSARER